MNSKRKTILLVGGGTGGHIIPILNIRDELKKNPKLKVYTIGGDSSIDKKFYTGLSNHLTLKTGKMHRSITFENIFQFFLLLWGMTSAFLILKRIKPDVIFSKAGFVSFPVIFWSKILNIPYFIHESDIVMGAANRFAASHANKIFVGFPVDNYPYLDKTQLEFVGQIIRPIVLQNEEKMYDFGFENNKPSILVTGGSQGAKNINKAVFQILEEILNEYNVIHHTGSLDYGRAIEARSKLNNKQKKSYFISPLLTVTKNKVDIMKSAIFQSKIVISRASATTLAEVSTAKKAIIAVPYKFAASDHQSKNADYYKKNRAAVVISDDHLNGKTLKKEIDKLVTSSKIMKEMGENAFNLQVSYGVSKIVEELEFFNRKCEKL